MAKTKKKPKATANKDWWIKLEIGQWEQDVNTISIEAEGALLKLIFKLTHSATKGRFDFALDSLSILFKTTPEKALKIIEELKRKDILNITYLPDDYVRIESRRLLKEAAKSTLQSANGKQGGRGNKKEESEIKANQKPNESDPLTLTLTNNSYSDLGESAERGVSQWILFDQEFCAGIRSRYDITQPDFDHMLEQFELSRVEKSIVYETSKEMKAGFQKWVNSWIKNEKTRGNGVTTFIGDNRSPKNHPDGKRVQNQILTNGEEALIDAVLARKVDVK